MAKREHWREIPAELSLEQFREFVLPPLRLGSRGPDTKLLAYTLFNYILKQLYLGCQWKELPIARDTHGRWEIHYTRVWRAFRKWEADGCIDAIFDSYFPGRKLVAEIDGSSHRDHGQARHDRERDAYFARQDIKTIRLSNRTVLSHPKVCRKLVLTEPGMIG